MARKWSNVNLPGALHYLTGNVNHRIPIFKRDSCCLAFLNESHTLFREWPCKLITYVVMPDHFHSIVNPSDGDIIGFGGALKSLSARAIIEETDGDWFLREKPDLDGSIHQVWQEALRLFPYGAPG